jgi:type III secretion protein D
MPAGEAMSHPHDDLPFDASLEIRVLDGELSGARSVVDAAEWVSVGAQLPCDVVLRASGARPFEAALKFRAARQGGVAVRVSQGVVTVSGQALALEVETALPLYTVLRVDGIALAIGRPDAPQWLGVDARSPAPVPEDTAPAAATPQARSAGLRRLAVASRWMVVGGAAAAAMCAGMWALANTVQPAEPSFEQRTGQLADELRAAGFDGLSVKAVLEEGARQARVSGDLDTVAQQARLESFLAGQPLRTRLTLRVQESLSAAVLEIFRANEVQASLRSARAGTLVLDTRSSQDADQLERIKAAALRDVPGLVALELHHQRVSAKGPGDNTAASIDDPGKRVESIVPGEMAYVVTADGSRYFEGAFMPTGHRIVAIHEKEVLLEKGGTVLPLRF